MTFLRKLGTRKADVDPHFRTVGGKQVFVRRHDREVEGVEATAPTEGEDAAREQALRSRQAKELELWKAWIAGGKKPEDLRLLIDSFKPMLQSRAKVFKGKVRIPDAAIDAEYLKQAVTAFLHYDPSKGALGTFLFSYLNKVKRFIAKNQNIARIPEHRVFKIHEFQVAQQELEAKLGRPANDLELAGYLKWKVPEVARMSKELVKDLWTHGFEDDPSATRSDPEEGVLRLIKYELTDDEKKVFAHIIQRSPDGSLKLTPGMTPARIAKLTGFNAYKVSRIKKGIADKVQRYLKGQAPTEESGTSLQGIKYEVQEPKGTVHSGVGGEGKYWRRESTHDFVRLTGARGIDGEELGAFIGPMVRPPRAYVAHQLTSDLSGYDKDVLFLGFGNEEEVRKAYMENAHNPDQLGALTALSTKELQQRAAMGGHLSFITEKKAEELAKQIQRLREAQNEQNPPGQ